MHCAALCPRVWTRPATQDTAHPGRCDKLTEAGSDPVSGFFTVHTVGRGPVGKPGCPALNVDSDVERESERANARGAFLSMDEYTPDALVSFLELLTKWG